MRQIIVEAVKVVSSYEQMLEDNQYIKVLKQMEIGRREKEASRNKKKV